MGRWIVRSCLSLLAVAVFCGAQAAAGEIHHAAAVGDLAGMKALIEADPNLMKARNSDGYTPLMVAAEAGRKEIAALLLDKGADVNEKCLGPRRKGVTALWLAADKRHRDVAEMLIARGARIRIETAIVLGMTEKVADLLTQEPGLIKGRDRGSRLLGLAASEGQKSIVKLLIAEGAEVNGRDGQWPSPLTLAIMEDHKEVAGLLLEEGADPNVRWHEWTLLMYIADGESWFGHTMMPPDKVMAELLIENGADVNAKTRYGETALALAAQSCSADVVALLLAHGAKVDPNKGPDLTPLHRASGAVFPYILPEHKGDKAIVELLLAKGANVNAKTDRGMTPLHMAVLSDTRDVVEVLIANGADVNARTKDGWTPLHVAALEARKDLVEILLAKGADASVKAKDGWTPLHVAAYNGNKYIVEDLVARGADVNAKDKEGRTPLQVSHSREVSEFLREYGARD